MAADNEGSKRLAKYRRAQKTKSMREQRARKVIEGSYKCFPKLSPFIRAFKNTCRNWLSKSRQEPIIIQKAPIKIIVRASSSRRTIYWPPSCLFNLIRPSAHMPIAFRSTSPRHYTKPLTLREKHGVNTWISWKLHLNIISHQATSLKAPLASFFQILAIRSLLRPLLHTLAPPRPKRLPLCTFQLTLHHISTLFF